MRLPALCAFGLAGALSTLAGAVNFTVDSSANLPDVAPGNGFCATASGVCTLRAAIMETNALAGADEIALGVATIQLVLTGGPDDETGDLDILDDLTIQGAGMHETVIAAQQLDRVFEIDAPVVLLSDLTIRDGRVAGDGGGLRVVSGETTCRRCLIAGNEADGAFGGGAEIGPSASLVLRDSIVQANLAAGGGGVEALGDLTLFRSQILDNRSNGNGGGVRVYGVLHVDASTIARNRARLNGGGFDLKEDANCEINNSTISSNEATDFDGGGIFATAGAIASLHNVTIASNFAGRIGGGLRTNAAGVSLTDCALADSAAVVSGNDCSCTITSGGHNLFESGGIDGEVASDILGVDPGLLALGNYGGTTPTQEMSTSASALFNAGDNATCEDLDQRSHPRPRSGTCDIGATELFGFVSAGLVIDPGAANNGVLEPNEEVVVRASIRSLLQSSFDVAGSLEPLAGPPTPAFTYEVVDGAADYGTVGAGATKSCSATPDCYRIAIEPTGAPGGRPLQHWDVTWDEAIVGQPLTTRWRIHVGESFTDLGPQEDFYPDAEIAFHHGVSQGCGGTSFCPADALTRRELALLLTRAKHGEFFIPPRCVNGSEPFDDIEHTDAFCPWIAALAEDGITQGCGSGNFCPANPLRRGHAARLLLRAVKGASFNPGGCDALYGDTAIEDCAWVEAAVAEDLMELCAPGVFCPDDPLTRQATARALGRAFGLEIYSF